MALLGVSNRSCQPRGSASGLSSRRAVGVLVGRGRLALAHCCGSFVVDASQRTLRGHRGKPRALAGPPMAFSMEHMTFAASGYRNPSRRARGDVSQNKGSCDTHHERDARVARPVRARHVGASRAQRDDGAMARIHRQWRRPHALPKDRHLLLLLPIGRRTHTRRRGAGTEWSAASSALGVLQLLPRHQAHQDGLEDWPRDTGVPA